MRSVTVHHDEAMDLAAQALMAQLRGDQQEELRLLNAALEESERAAVEVLPLINLEPTRSIILQSAALLALDCSDFDRAERFAAMALAGRPSDRLRDEFHSIFSRATFRRHLKLRGISLTEDQVRLSVEGSAVAPGIVERTNFERRVEAFAKLLQRTADRKKNLPYRTAGRIADQSHTAYDLFYEVAEAASFAVILRVGEHLSPVDIFASPKDVVHEVVECLEMFEQEQEVALRERIGSDSYFTNFMGLAKEMQPDGINIRLVGLSVCSDGKVKEVPLQRIRRRTSRSPEPLPQEPLVPSPKKARLSTISGFLEAADSRKERGKGVIILTDTGEGQVRIRVPDGLADIVRLYYDKYVTVELDTGSSGRLLKEIYEDTGGPSRGN